MAPSPGADGRRMPPRWTVAALGASALALLLGLAIYLRPLAPSVVALQLSFDRSAFEAVLGAWGASGVALYRSHFGADFVLLLLYGLFGLSLRRRALSGALVVAALADAVENLLHLRLTDLTEGNAAAPTALYALAGAAATLKWLGLAAFVLAVAAGLWLRGRRAR